MTGPGQLAVHTNQSHFLNRGYHDQIKILKNIAHIHAHDYRAPVCAILGIMNLIEGEGYIAPKYYFLMLQKAAKELYEKTRSVISLISDLSMV